jgi:cation:H+ antiporter
MSIYLLLFAVGVGLVFKGSDLFVDASVAIGKRARLPRVVVGGTIVSLATTSPELTVAVIAGIDKVPGIAIGNALGSVAANLGFVLALAAMIRPFAFSPGEFSWRSLIMLGFTMVLFLMTLDLSLTQWRGLMLVGIGVLYLFLDYRRGQRRYAASGEAIGETAGVKLESKRRIGLLFLLGVAMVIGGSRLLVSSGIAIAEAVGVPPLIVGLTMVAVGTSLPELATAITAVRKRVFDLSVGNLIGANALNLTIVTGTAASIYPLALTRTTQIYTFPSILVILIVFFLLVRTKNRLIRWEGALLMTLYLAFIAGLAALNP